MGVREEIASGPLAEELWPWVAIGNTDMIIKILNEPRFVAPGPCSRARFAMWCGKTGLRAVIQDHADTPASPLRSIALTIIDFLRGSAESVDMSEAANQAMLTAWLGAGAITQEQHDDLLAMSMRLISRAEQAGLVVTAETLAGALT